MEAPGDSDGPPRKRPRPAFDPGLLASPFYRGPTVYGGAGSAESSRRASRLPALYRRPVSCTPAPTTPSSATPTIGRTARRIADLLAQCESPLADVRRRERTEAPPQRTQAPPRKELRPPSLAVLLRLKRRNRCVASAQAALAASLSSSAPYNPTDYSLPVSTTADGPSAAPGKLRSQVSRHGSRDRPQEPSPPSVVLPDAVLTLPDGRLPEIRLSSTPPPLPEPKSLAKFVFSKPIDASLPGAVDSYSSRFFSDRKPAPIVAIEQKSTERDRPPAEKLADVAPLPELKSASDDRPRDEVAPSTVSSSVIAANLLKFVKKSNQWECDACLTTNADDKLSCVCCETPKPGLKPPPPTAPAIKNDLPKFDASGLAGFAKKKEGNWECPSCMISNEADKSKCVCCEEPKPGAQPQKSNFSFGTTPNTYKFGIDKVDAPAVPAVKFDLPKADSIPASNFTFGLPPAAETKPPEFKFGLANGKVPVDSNPAPIPAVIAAPALVNGEDNPKLPPTFSFGIKRPEKEATPERPAKVELPTFNFPIPSSKPAEIAPAPAPIVPKIESPKLPELPAPVSVPSFAIPASTTTTSPSTSTPPRPLFSFNAPPQTTTETKDPPKFGFEAKSPPAPAPSGLFNFGVKAEPVVTTPEPPKPIGVLNNSFALPSTSASSLFSVTSASIPAKINPVKDITSPIRFPAVTTTSDSTPRPIPTFTFGSAATPATTTTSDPFKSAPPPMFSFGAPASSVSTNPTPAKQSIFGSTMTPTNMFGNDKDKADNSPFKPGSVTSAFSSGANMVFGAQASTVNSQPGQSIFGSRPSVGDNKTASTSIFGNRPLSGDNKSVPTFGSTSITSGNVFSSNNTFMNNQSEVFNANGTFGSSTNATSTPSTNLFGSQTTTKPEPDVFGAKVASPTSNMFGNAGMNQPASNAPIFGSTSPSFGSAMPFGVSQNQSPSSQFKFGDSAPGGNFGAPPPAAPGVFAFGSQPTQSQFNFSMGTNTGTPRPPFGPNTLPPRRYKKAVRRNMPQ